MDVLTQLRSKTKVIHDELESISGVDKIMDHTITLNEYQELLKVNYLIYSNAERHISEFIDVVPISNRIKNDLTIVPEIINVQYSIKNKYEAIGAKYVVEGSLLGAAVISKALMNCKQIQPLEPQHFYNQIKAEDRKIWPDLMKTLKSNEFNNEQQQSIINGALNTFLMFKTIYLSSDVKA